MHVNALHRISSRVAGVSMAIGMLLAPCWMDQLSAQVPTEKLFGDGIHRFYDGDYQGVIAELAQFINEDMEDPRVYYLRGLAFLRTQEPELARDDMRKGAELEAIQYGKRNYNIARALQRVQGNDRALIEAARADAMRRRGELRSAKAGIPRDQILAEMGRSVLDPPAVNTSRPNLPDASTLEDATAPFGQGAQAAGQGAGHGAGQGANNPNRPNPTPIAPKDDADDPFSDPPARSEADPFSDPPVKNEVDPFGGLS